MSPINQKFKTQDSQLKFIRCKFNIIVSSKISEIHKTQNIIEQTRCDQYEQQGYVEDNVTTNASFQSAFPIFLSLGHLHFDKKDVFDALVGLDSKKGSGPIKVYPVVLKKCAQCYF